MALDSSCVNGGRLTVSIGEELKLRKILVPTELATLTHPLTPINNMTAVTLASSSPDSFAARASYRNPPNRLSLLLAGFQRLLTPPPGWRRLSAPPAFRQTQPLLARLALTL